MSFLLYKTLLLKKANTQLCLTHLSSVKAPKDLQLNNNHYNLLSNPEATCRAAVSKHSYNCIKVRLTFLTLKFYVDISVINNLPKPTAGLHHKNALESKK